MLIATDVSHLVQIIIQIFSSENFGDSNQLIVVVMTVEKWLFAEDHWSQHASKRPHIEWVIIKLYKNGKFLEKTVILDKKNNSNLIVDKKLGAFEISRSNSNIVILSGMIEFG